MVAISSHRNLRDIKMRVLILSAVLACAVAAPSGFIAPVIAPFYPSAVPIPAIYNANLQPIPAGDIQAAVIDAQVKARDWAQSAVDQARDLTDQATANLNEKVLTANDLVKEKNAEIFWSLEDKRWQALDSLNTAQSQLEAAVASNQGVEAAVRTAVVEPAIVASVTVEPVAPVDAAAEAGAPAAKSEPTDAQAEEVKAEVSEEAVKSAEPGNVEEVKVEEKKEDSEVVADNQAVEDAAAAAKAAADALKQKEEAYIAFAQSLKGQYTAEYGPLEVGPPVYIYPALGLSPSFIKAV